MRIDDYNKKSINELVQQSNEESAHLSQLIKQFNQYSLFLLNTKISNFTVELGLNKHLLFENNSDFEQILVNFSGISVCMDVNLFDTQSNGLTKN